MPYSRYNNSGAVTMSITDHWLTQRVKARTLAITKFSRHLWILDARGVAYLPALDWLIVSDLHLEKGSYLSGFANPLPNLDSRATLERLSRILDDYRPETVISLGDSFHDRQSMSRMDDNDKQRLCELVNTVSNWKWIEGNHDPQLPEGIPGEACYEIVLDNMVFRHEPQKREQRHQIIGHYHPKMRTQIAHRRYSGKCFVFTDDVFVMPAFGQFTGGLDVNDDVMKQLLPYSRRTHFLMYDTIIFKA